MIRFFMRVMIPSVLASMSLTNASEIEIKSYDSNTYQTLPFTNLEIINGTLKMLDTEYTAQDIEEKTPEIIKRTGIQLDKLQEGKRHLIIATDSTQAIVGLSWVSNPKPEIIIINQSNAKSIDINALCSAKSLALFPQAEIIQLAIMKQRATIIQLLQYTGWTQTEQPSSELDDESVDSERESFFEIPTSKAMEAMMQMKQLIEQAQVKK